MTDYTSDKEGVRLLVDSLAAKGVRHVVLSPGSRNAPLLVAFGRERRMRHHVVVDERSAAFMALGMAQQSGEPVVLACTSGTAVLNYGPALAEALYQRLPLIAVTADRPEEWIDQEDSQTIRQRDVFRNIVKASYQIPSGFRDADEAWFAGRQIEDALNTALGGQPGPVHLNLPLKEPLYGTVPAGPGSCRDIRRLEPAGLSATMEEELLERFRLFRRVMIVAGFHRPSACLSAALHRLASLPQVTVLAETVSNLDSPLPIPTVDRVLATVPEEEREQYRPDLLVSFGGSLVSRHLKQFLRKYPPRSHWYIDRGEHLADTFRCMDLQIAVEAEELFPRLAGRAVPCLSDYAARWQEKRRLASARHADFGRTAPWSDWKAFSLFWPSVPAGTFLQLSNGTCVRYAQLFGKGEAARTDCNRGTSGIDGSTSTAVGASVLNPGLTLLVTGDMSFIYDSNALWNPYITPRFKIIVMRNGGGGIFRFIPGPSTLEELEECFETRTEVDVEGFARLHHFAFFRAGDEKELLEGLPRFWGEEDRPAILCIDTPSRENAGVLKAYFRHLAGEGCTSREQKE